jgi:SAM-dependent methyltransferase
MQPDKLNALWNNYRSRPVITTVHQNDHMFKTNPHLDGYDMVGESAARVIHAMLAMAPKEAVWRVLDFGCGHGRVARHIRAMFPTAEMWFADSDLSCVDFCAGTFNGTPVLSYADFDKAELPTGMDLVWVGSVFTHIDYKRMEVLFDKLFATLGIGGLLIATFRGHRTYEVAKQKPNQAKIYKQMLESYESTGIGYQSYERQELGDWGLSLSSIERVVALGKRHPNARLVGYSEAGWANIHDVGAWIKVA